MNATHSETTCCNAHCTRLDAHDDCNAPIECSDCHNALTDEEALEERAAVRPQCFACIEKTWAATEMKIRARHAVPPPARGPLDTIPAPAWGDEEPTCDDVYPAGLLSDDRPLAVAS